MNKLKLSRAIAENMGCPIGIASKFIDALSQVALKEISQDGYVIIGSIGSLMSYTSRERRGISPATKEHIIIPSKIRSRFVPHLGLKKVLKERNLSLK